MADGGAPAGGGSLKRADLMPAADSAPGECFSVARYRLLHDNTAVSFVSSDIRVFFYCRHTVQPDTQCDTTGSQVPSLVHASGTGDEPAPLDT